MTERRFSRVSAFALLGVLTLFALSGLWFAHAVTPVDEPAEVAEQKLPVIPLAKGDQCVADTALMRTDHMNLLNHQRDETVVEGIRGKPFSLVECVDCHAQTEPDGQAIRIDAKGQFCESCHSFAAVKIDCFSCHAAVPEQKDRIGLWRSRDLKIFKTELASTQYFMQPMPEANHYFAEHHGKAGKTSD